MFSSVWENGLRRLCATFTGRGECFVVGKKEGQKAPLPSLIGRMGKKEARKRRKNRLECGAGKERKGKIPISQYFVEEEKKS